MNPILTQFRSFSPFLKLLFMLMLVITGMVIITLIGVLTALPFYGSATLDILLGNYDLTNPVHLSLLKYIQIISHFAMFIIPAIVYAKLFEGGGRSFFMLRNRQSLIILIIGAFVMILMLPFVNFLGDMNAGLRLPESLQSLEQWMKTTEESAEAMIMAFVSQTEWIALVINLFMIAFIPAIGEELVFRGILQRKLGQWFGNPHVAIFVSAVIFSAIHMQFFGFLPRLFLGILLGYMFLWSGSILLPMVAHFINNGLAVVVAWMYASGYIETDMESFGHLKDAPAQMWLITLMAFAALGILWFLNKKVNPFYHLLFRDAVSLKEEHQSSEQ